MNPPRLFDLSLTLRDGMRGVAFAPARTMAVDGWNARTLSLYSHAGTHMDAQTHFAAGPGTIEQTPLERCMGWAWVINLVGIPDKTLITPEHLGSVATRFQPGESLLLRLNKFHLKPHCHFYLLPRVCRLISKRHAQVYLHRHDPSRVFPSTCCGFHHVCLIRSFL